MKTKQTVHTELQAFSSNSGLLTIPLMPSSIVLNTNLS